MFAHWLDASTYQLQSPGHDGLIQAMMIGAGFPRALVPTSPGWLELVQDVWRALEGEEPPPENEPRLLALRLSWKHARRLRGAQASPFQEAVARQIGSHWSTGLALDDRQHTLARELKAFISATRCSVIIDLNYDPAVELALHAAGTPFIRAIGSELHWTMPFPDGVVLLWKVHGAVDKPSTIVLSPSEYQRVYEANALAEELGSLGRSLENIWSIGVSLTDDDVWASLIGPRCTASIVGLWLDHRATRDRLAEHEDGALKNWLQMVSPPPLAGRANDASISRSVVVLTADLSVPLADRLKQLSTSIRSGQVAGKPTWQERSRPTVRRSGAFDLRYEHALELGTDAALRAAVEEFREDYRLLREYLLCRRDGGVVGARWLPAVPLASGSSPEHGREVLARDCVAVVKSALDLCDALVQLTHERPTGLLAVAAAQAAVAYVVEVAELHGVDVHTQLGPVDGTALRKLRLADRQRLVVGCDPFTMGDLAGANPLHFTVTRRQIPIVSILDPTPRLGAPATLLTEDEWEAGVQHLYFASEPCLVFRWGASAGEQVDVPVKSSKLPPLYPWGFRFLDVRDYRTRGTGDLSRAWYLVDTYLANGRQVCKGGGLRDRSPNAFRIGGRGSLRAGEYDEFVRKAYC